MKERQPQCNVISEVVDFSIEPQHIRGVSVPCPSYDLPPNYIISFMNASGVGPSTQHIIQIMVTTEAPPLVHTFAQGPFDDPCFAYRASGPQDGIKKRHERLMK